MATRIITRTDTSVDPGDNPSMFQSGKEATKRLSMPDIAAALTAAAITLVVLWFVHGPIILEPNTYVFSTQGEAIRNYYVISYHAESGGSLHEFSGMNYPFGEQIVFSEGQPSLSYPLKFLSRFSPWFHQHAVGTLNIFLIAGIALSAALLLLIFRRLRVGLILSSTSAIGVALLAPQCSRLPWMFPQAFSALVPIVIYLVIRMVDADWTWKSVVPLVLANLFFLFLNPYPGLIAVSFTAVTLPAILLLCRGRKPNLINDGLKVLACTLMPVVLFKHYLRTTDLHTGRPAHPGGFFDFTAEFSSLFASFFSPVMPWLERYTGLTREMAWKHYEGNGYLGVFCLLVLVLALAHLVWRRVVRRSPSCSAFGDPDNRVLAALVAGALALSVFAFGLPFRLIEHGELWLGMLGPLGQFRAPGRFIWPLFYVLNLVAVVMAARAVASVSLTRIRRLATSAAVVAGSCLMIYEGVAQHQWVANRGQGTVNVLNRRVVEQTPSLASIDAAIAGINPSRYQAILTIPLFHIGSELLHPPSSFSEDLLRDSLALSKHLKLPLTSAMLGRISLEESMATFRLYTPAYVAKDICNRLGPKPLLVLANRDRSLSPEETSLMARARPLFSTDRFELLEIEISQLCQFDQESVIDTLVARIPVADWDDPIVTDQPLAVHLDNFDRFPVKPSMRGNGALTIPSGQLVWIFDTASLPNAPEIGKTYVLSFWFFNRGDRLNADVFVESNRPEGPSEVHSLPGLKRTFFHQDDWSLFSLTVSPNHAEQRIRVGFQSTRHDEDLAVDDLLFRPEHATVIWDVNRENGHVRHLVWNNHDLSRSGTRSGPSFSE